MKSTLRKLKRVAKTAMGKDFFIKEDIQCSYKSFGSEYGSWDLVIDELNKDSIIYSIGVGEDASFDVALIDDMGLTIYAFDPTPKSIKWVEEQQFSPKFVMHEYGIADFDGFVSFSPPENPDHVSHTILDRPSTKDNAIEVSVKKLETIMESLGHSAIDVLKMDIEGAEYAVIKNIESTDIRPKQILIEFHHRFPGVGIEKTKEAIEIIKKMGYGLFSVSDTGEEFSFKYKNS